MKFGTRTQVVAGVAAQLFAEPFPFSKKFKLPAVSDLVVDTDVGAFEIEPGTISRPIIPGKQPSDRWSVEI